MDELENARNRTISPGNRAAGRLVGLLRDLREAILGSQQDFTEGRLGRAIILLATPMVLEMLMESVFAVCDIFFVGRLGADAVATVGLTESLLTIVFSLGLGLGMATTAMVARRIGEKNPEGASVAAVQSIGLGLQVSLLIGIAGMFLAPTLLRSMGATESIISTGSSYTAVMLGGNATILMLFLINAVFRGAGDAAIAMRVLWLSNIINILLDPCLIFGWGPFPELGVTGAAVATNIGRGTGVAYQLWLLLRGRGRIRVRPEHIRYNPAVILRLLRISVGGILQFFIATASWLGLVRIIAVFGSAPLAGYTIALRIMIFAFLPSWGLSNAAATLVGQNLGAGKPERAERSVLITGISNMLFLGMVGLIFILIPDILIQLFIDDPAVVPFGTDCLRYISYGVLFYAYGMVIVQAFNGAGDTFTPTLINFFCYWLFQIPLAYILALPLGLEAQGVFLAITLSESTIALVSLLVFRRGRWKRQIV